MEEALMIDEMFRFTLVRPPQRQTPQGRSAPVIPAYAAGRSDFAQIVAQQSPEVAREAARRFIAGQSYVADLALLNIPLAAFDIALLPPAPPSADHARAALQDLFGAPAEHVVSSDVFRHERERLADSLLAVVLADQRYAPGQERLVRGLQLCAAIEALADPAAGATELAMALRGLVVLPRLHSKARLVSTRPTRQPTPEQRALGKELRQLGEMRSAIAELQRIYRRKQLQIAARGTIAADAAANLPAPEHLNHADYAGLTPATRRIFTALDLPSDSLQLPGLVKHLEGYLNAEMQGLLSRFELQTPIMFGAPDDPAEERGRAYHPGRSQVRGRRDCHRQGTNSGGERQRRLLLRAHERRVRQDGYQLRS
jgi:hypothetical protein